MERKILLVEDDLVTAKGLEYLLEHENFKVVIANSVTSAEANLSENLFDLAILDICLPGKDSFSFTENLEQANTPFIFLTACDEEKDIVKGLDLGAEDYILKPFRSRELLSRIKNVLRRHHKDLNIVYFDKLKIDFSSAMIFIGEKEIKLTSLEFKLFARLIENVNSVVKREALLDEIWDATGNYVDSNTLSVYIKRIRRKLGADCIKTVKNVGYRLEEK